MLLSERHSGYKEINLSYPTFSLPNRGMGLRAATAPPPRPAPAVAQRSRQRGMEPRPRRATLGRKHGHASPSQVQGPPSSGLPAPPRAASSCPPPKQSSQRLTAPVSLGPHPGQETGCSESGQPTPGTRTEIIVPTHPIQSHPQHN